MFLNPLHIMVCVQTLFISRAEYYSILYCTICLWYFIFLLLYIELAQHFAIMNIVVINIIVQTSATIPIQLQGTCPLMESLGDRFIWYIWLFEKSAICCHSNYLLPCHQQCLGLIIVLQSSLGFLKLVSLMTHFCMRKI